MKSKTRKLRNSAAILIISGVTAKVLAALYRFPYQNLVGDLGFYAYQQVYPLMSIITTIALVALPNFLSKEIQGYQDKPYFFKKFFQLSMLIATAIFLFLLVLSRPLAYLMGEVRLYPVLIAGSLPLLTLPLLSLARGYYQADELLDVTAKSQLVEQLVRVLIIWLSAYLFVKLNLDVYQIATLSMLGSFIGGIAALSATRVRFSFSLWQGFFDFKGILPLFRRLIKSSANFIYFAIYLLLFQLVDAFCVKNALVALGFNTITAQLQKGIFDRAQPFVQLGLTFSLAILTQSLPKLNYTFKQNAPRYQQLIKQKVKIITIFSAAITIGMFMVLSLMNRVLFKNNAGIFSLRMYVIAIFLISLIQTLHYHYEIIGQKRRNSQFLTIGLVVKVLSTYLLTRYFGIFGSSLSTVLSLLIVFSCYYLKEWQLFYFDKRLLITLAVMIATVAGLNQLLDFQGRTQLLIKVVVLSLAGVVVLLGLLFKLNVINFQELRDEEQIDEIR
ncbi:MAG: oligosaccharide flippase family protein [Streptococcaceae bacterium]|jgi:PST family polysaccharide transporter|nr:oligosaccharide flippase family protein [Streptococcaceae bacterium]